MYHLKTGEETTPDMSHIRYTTGKQAMHNPIIIQLTKHCHKTLKNQQYTIVFDLLPFVTSSVQTIFFK